MALDAVGTLSATGEHQIFLCRDKTYTEAKQNEQAKLTTGKLDQKQKNLMESIIENREQQFFLCLGKNTHIYILIKYTNTFTIVLH